MNNIFEKINIEKIKYYLMIFLSIEVISLSFSIAVSSIAFVISIMLWVIILLKEKKWTKTPLDYLFIFYILAEIIASVFSVDPIGSAARFKRVFIFTVFYMTFYSFRKEKDLTIFFIVISSMLGIQSVLEIIIKYTIQIERIGIFQHYMTTGGIKMIVSLFIIPFVFQKNLDKKLKIFFVIVLIPILITLILTMTRSSWFGFIFGIITFGFLKNKYSIIGLTLLLILLAIFSPERIKERALSSFDPNSNSNKPRLNMISTGWRIFLDNPITGVGDIDLKKIYFEYTIPLESDEGGHLHNIYIHILVTLGIIGFSAFICLFTGLAVHLFRVYKLAKNHIFLSSVSVIPLMVFVAFLVNGLFEWNFGDQEIAILFWFTMGLSMAVKQIIYLNTKSKEDIEGILIT